MDKEQKRLTNLRGVDVIDEMSIEELLGAVRKIRGMTRLMIAQPLLIPDVLWRLESEFQTIEERFTTKERVSVDVDLYSALPPDVQKMIKDRNDLPSMTEPPETIDPDSDEGKAIRDQLVKIGGDLEAKRKTADVILPIVPEK